MRWPSFLQRKDRGAPATDEDAVQAARLRARRRLIGAVVLLAFGLIGFPLLFETQPRPVSPDIPFDVARRAPAMPPPVHPVEPAPAPPAPADGPRREAAARERAAPALAESARPEPALAEAPAAASEAAPVAVAVAPAVPTVAARPAAAYASAAASGIAAAERPPRPVVPAAAERASAVPAAAASAPEAARYVLQVGAFAEAATVRDVRSKVEKLGLKTYTQVVETPSGARTRVRIGPFDTREAAAAAGARLKDAGLPFNLLTL